jgi:hypothetical protein
MLMTSVAFIGCKGHRCRDACFMHVSSCSVLAPARINEMNELFFINVQTVHPPYHY